MYQIYCDVIKKVSGYLTVARQFKDDVELVKVSNEIIEIFGKRYCRIYVNIKLKEHLGYEKEIELERTLDKEVATYLPKYFSFHLGSGSWSESQGTDGRNTEEETHYNYIWHLLAISLEKDKIKVEAEHFINDWQVNYEWKQRNAKFDEEWQKVEEVVESLTPQEGQLIAINEYGNNLRIALATKVTMPSRKHSFSMDLVEVLKDLSQGKRELRYISKRSIYAIVQPESLPKRFTKNELIEKIEKGESFDGLLWRRPQELWN